MNKKVDNTLTSSQKRIFQELQSAEGKIADWITTFSGSMSFVYFHIVWFSLWVLINHGVFLPYIFPFDPFPYGLLTMFVSLEAIFLSTFIMISQNRQALLEKYKDIEEDIEEKEDEEQQEELEEEVQDIQTDLDDIKKAISLIEQKVLSQKSQNGNPT